MSNQYNGLQKVVSTLKDGSESVRYYTRNPRRRLPGQPGDPEFEAAYDKFVNGRGVLAVTPKNFAQLVARYKQSAEFMERKQRTREEYDRILLLLCKKFGTLETEWLNDRRVRELFEKYRAERKNDGLRAADNDIAILKRVLNWAVGKSYIDTNHAAKFGKLYKANRSKYLWKQEHLDCYLEALQGDSREQSMTLAVMLALYTGQRLSDLLILKWDDIEEDKDQHGKPRTYIRLRQGKTDSDVLIPLHPVLKAKLDQINYREGTILKSTLDTPWTRSGFSTAWRQTKLKAGPKVADLHFHDLRGTAVTLLADAGASVPEIAAITGHKLKTVEQILEKYLYRTTRQAENAIDKSAATVHLKW